MQAALAEQSPLSVRRPTLREGTATDMKFVRTEWCNSYVWGCGLRMAEDEFRPAKPFIWDGEWDLSGRLIDRSAVLVLEYPGQVVSFLVYDATEPVVHYALTTRDHRRNGHLRQLLDYAGLIGKHWTYSRWTPLGRAVFRRLGGAHDQYAVLRLLGALPKEQA